MSSISLKEKIKKSRSRLSEGLAGIFSLYETPDPGLWESMEELLISGDVGVGTSLDVISKLRQVSFQERLVQPDQITERMKSLLKEVMIERSPLNLSGQGLEIILFVGVNGTGKTTSIAKLAKLLKDEGKEVILAAADTYRAAAIEQLEEWGRRLDLPVIKHQRGSDPGAVVYDAIGFGQSRGKGVLIVDTAGRLHTQVNLMEELKKIKRVISRQIEEAPHEVLMVIDATTGQNGISQAKLFNEAVGLSGIFLAKLDGTAKGGIVIAIERELDVPVKLVGTGETPGDIDFFDPEEFIDALVGMSEIT